MKLLLTAFAPFGGESINPAQEAVKLVPDRIGPVDIVRCYVPTVFGKSIKTVAEAIEKVRPDTVLCIGQAGERSKLTPERVAINLDDATIPDNEGNQPVDTKIFPDGPNALFTTLPVKAMVTAIRNAGVPATLSCSAGTFVCNHLMYGILYTLEMRYPGVRGGFMHVPCIPQQVKAGSDTPSLPLSDIVKGINAAISAIAESDKDRP